MKLCAHFREWLHAAGVRPGSIGQADRAGTKRGVNMRKLLRRVFGAVPDDNSSLPNAPEARDQLIGENVLLKFILDGLGNRIVVRLKATEGWPFDLGDALSEGEEFVLSLWGFSRAVTNIRAVSIEEGQAFLDRFHGHFVYPALLKEGMSPFKIRELSRLAVERYPEYHVAFDEMMQERRELHEHPDTGPRVPEWSFVRVVTRHLFGRETDNLIVTLLIGTMAMDHFSAFAETLGSEQGWPSFSEKVARHFKP